MDGEERDPERSGGADRPGDRIRDVVEFEIQKDFLTAGDQVVDNGGADGGKQFLAYLVEADGFAKFSNQCASLIFAGDIECHDQLVSAISHGNRITDFPDKNEKGCKAKSYGNEYRRMGSKK